MFGEWLLCCSLVLLHLIKLSSTMPAFHHGTESTPDVPSTQTSLPSNSEISLTQVPQTITTALNATHSQQQQQQQQQQQHGLFTSSHSSETDSSVTTSSALKERDHVVSVGVTHEEYTRPPNATIESQTRAKTNSSGNFLSTLRFSGEDLVTTTDFSVSEERSSTSQSDAVSSVKSVTDVSTIDTDDSRIDTFSHETIVRESTTRGHTDRPTSLDFEMDTTVSTQRGADVDKITKTTTTPVPIDHGNSEGLGRALPGRRPNPFPPRTLATPPPIPTAMTTDGGAQDSSPIVPKRGKENITTQQLVVGGMLGIGMVILILALITGLVWRRESYVQNPNGGTVLWLDEFKSY